MKSLDYLWKKNEMVWGFVPDPPPDPPDPPPPDPDDPGGPGGSDESQGS